MSSFLFGVDMRAEPYIASTTLMSDKDVAMVIRINIHLKLLFLSYEVELV